MAKETRILTTCDVCSAEIDTEEHPGLVQFSVDNGRYQIDLCSDHRAEFYETMGSWIQQAVTLSATPKYRPRAGRRDPAAVQAIRSWARENGYDIRERGRIPREIVEKYTERQAS